MSLLDKINKIPTSPGDLSKLALIALEVTKKGDCEISDSFIRFANSTVSKEILRSIGHVGEQPPAQLIVHYQYCRWAMEGLSVFRPSEGLAAGLALTDIDNVPANDWKWPFNSFLVHIPYDFWAMTSMDDGKPDPVNMILVNKMKTMYNEPAAMLLMLGRRGSLAFSQVIRVPDDSSMLLGEWLEEVRRTNENNIGGIDVVSLSETDRHYINRSWKLIINLCLYITERGKGEKVVYHTTKSARRKARQLSEQFSKPNVWILGSEVKISRDLISAARSQATDAPAWKVSKRFIVRGHWRDQACGPGLTLRKRIMIEPHWKGPKEGERLSHLYTIVDNK